jgi:4-carboxymuconolactone decarboxylase
MALAHGALDHATAALIALAATAASGTRDEVRTAVAAAIDAGVGPRAVDELVLQSVLTIGWPRALVAADVWRAASGAAPTGGNDGLDYAEHPAWAERGEEICRVIYGESFEKLRSNVQALHPALERWMIVEGYGRTLSRPGLPLPVRELCTVAQIAVLDAPRQLHSHLLGALRAGASIEAVEATLALVRPMVDPADQSTIHELWDRVRSAAAGRS